MSATRLPIKPGFWRAVGVMAIWAGNENSLFIGNLAVADDNGDEKITRGENWTAPQDLTQGVYTDQPGYVAFSTPGLKDTFVREGEVAWLAGAGFAKDYEKYLDSGGRDLLGFKLWHRFPDGCAMQLGPSRTFYDSGGRLARTAAANYEGSIVRGADYSRPEIQAARRIYEGSPGVSKVERRIADAFWYYVSEDYEMFSRTEAQAERFDGISQQELAAQIKKKLAFYTEPRFAEQAAITRALLEENRRLRSIISHRPSAAFDTSRYEIEVVKGLWRHSNHLLLGNRIVDEGVASRSIALKRLFLDAAREAVYVEHEIESVDDEQITEIPYEIG